MTEVPRIEFVWTRGRYTEDPWAVSILNPEIQIQIVQDALDYDVLETSKTLTRTNVQVVVYPVSADVLNEEEVLAVFRKLDLEGDCHVVFYFASDQSRSHVAAYATRIGAGAPKITIPSKFRAKTP